jgi:hypothetical protein
MLKTIAPPLRGRRILGPSAWRTKKLGGEAAFVYQRVEDNAFHLRALSERWIGFSEDDVKAIAAGAIFTRTSHFAG